jgi:hypothetical protein
MRQLAHFWPDLIGGDLPKVLHSKAATLKRAAAQLNIRATDELLRGIAAVGRSTERLVNFRRDLHRFWTDRSLVCLRALGCHP